VFAVLAALALQAAPAAVPSARAEELGRQLAASGTLAQLAPILLARDIEDLLAEHAELSEADLATLRATSERVGRAAFERMLAVEGHAYAQALSEDDLALLVFFEAGDVARRRRAALPSVIAGTMQALTGVDVKADMIAAFCAETGKACTQP